MVSVSIRSQLHSNIVAIVSLTVAIVALLYTAWRSDQTEKNLTWRQAQFEVLKNLGELQAIVNNSHYAMGSVMDDPFLGWSRIALLSDLSQLLPPPVPGAIAKLLQVWQDNWRRLKEDKEAVEAVSMAIDDARAATLSSIRQLR